MKLQEWLIQHLGGQRILVRAHQNQRRHNASASAGPPNFDIRIYSPNPSREGECIEIKMFYEVGRDGGESMSLNMTRPYSFNDHEQFVALTSGWSTEWREQRQVVFTSSDGAYSDNNPFFMEELARVQGALEVMGSFGIEGFEVARVTAARIGALRRETQTLLQRQAPPTFWR